MSELLGEYKKEYLEKYGECMDEINLRLSITYKIIEGKLQLGNFSVDVETVFLHLRKMLELIALANLVSNKNEYEKAYHNFENHWNAKRILTDIEKINKDFYPRPFMFNKISNNSLELDYFKQGFLTKDEFVTLYDTCSQMLHSPNPYGKKKDPFYYAGLARDWRQKIMFLVSQHSVQLLNNRLIIVRVGDPAFKGKTSVSYFTGNQNI